MRGEKQEAVLRCLERSSATGLIETFVVLYRYFRKIGVGRAEQWAGRQNHALPSRCFDLKVHTPADRVSSLETLHALSDEDEFDGYALAMLGALDDGLRDVDLSLSSDIDDAGGDACFVFRSDPWLVGSVNKPARGADKQAGFLQRHVRYHTAALRQPLADVRRERDADWLPPATKRRMTDVRRDEAVKIVAWPFCSRPAMAEDCDLRGSWIRVHCTGVEASLQEQVRDAVRGADGATVLLLPELAFTEALHATLREELLAAERAPLVTVAGLVHRSDDEGLDINEAVVLDGSGQEMARHRKLRPFGTDLASEPVQERLLQGTELRTLESPIGSLGVLICYDLFSDVRALLEEAAPDILLVPSLSPKTSAHQTAAHALGVARQTVTFVANWWFVDESVDAPSFAWLHAGSEKDGLRPFRAAGDDVPLVFDQGEFAE